MAEQRRHEESILEEARAQFAIREGQLLRELDRERASLRDALGRLGRRR